MASNSLGTAWIQIKPSLNGISNDIKKELDSTATSGAKTFNTAFKGAFSGLGGELSKTFTTSLKKVETTTKAIFLGSTGAATAFLKSSLSVGKEFDSSMSQVMATLGYGVAELNDSSSEAAQTLRKLRDFAQEMGATTAFSAVQASEALNYMALAGYDAETSMRMLPTVLNLAAAGAMQLASASDMITDAQTALGLSLDETTAMVDQMARAASKSNTSVAQLGEAILTVGGTAQYMSGGTKELNTVLGVLADNGIKGSEAGTHLRNILLKLSAPTDDASALLKKLGVNIFDTEGKMKSFAEIFPDLNKAMADFTDQQKLDAFSTIFNTRDIASATALLGTTTERWEELGSAIMDSAGAAEEMANVQLDNLAGDTTLFKSALEGVKIAISDKLTPSLRDLVKVGTDGMEKIGEAVRAGDIDTATKNLAETLKRVVTEAVNILGEIAPIVMDILPDIVDAIVAGIVYFLGDQDKTAKVINGFVRLFMAVARGAGQIVQALVPLVPQIIGTFVSELVKPENIGSITAGLGILFSITTLKTVASNIGKNLKSTIGNKITGFFKTDIAKDGAEAAGNSVKKIGSSISSAIKGIAEPIKTAFVELGNILGSIVGAIMEPIKALLKGIGEALAGFFTALADPMIAVGAAMFAVAAGAVALAILMIGSALGAVAEPLGNFFDKVLRPLGDWIRDTLLKLLESVTDSMIRLTQGAVIPLANAVANSLSVVLNSIANVIDRVANAVIRLTQSAFIPLINTLAGSLMGILHTVGDVLNGVISSALNGVKDIVHAVGDAFESMGRAIRNVIDGVTGVIEAFGAIIQGVADAVVAIIAIANNRSIDYGRGYAYVRQMATGGLVGGDGTSFSDSNLFALSRGEYVIRASAARQIGYDNLDAMNESGQGFGSPKVEAPIYINGYNKDPNELAELVSRKIALRTKGVLA